VNGIKVRQPSTPHNSRLPRNKSGSVPMKFIRREVELRVANWTTGSKPNANFRPAKILFLPIEAMSYYIISTDYCVFLTCEGISSLDEMTAAWREVRNELAEKSLNRVLVDVTALQTSPTTAELFDLAKLFWHDGFPGFGRIALVVRCDQSRLAKSLEMLVRTLGMWLTVFVSEEQGEAWVWEGTLDEQAVEAFAK